MVAEGMRASSGAVGADRGSMLQLKGPDQLRSVSSVVDGAGALRSLN